MQVEVQATAVETVVVVVADAVTALAVLEFDLS
jgi:hypothetical protein